MNNHPPAAAGSPSTAVAARPAPVPIDPTETRGPPIFVVGTARSGTTLMQMMLSAHPRIFICFEISYYLWESRGSRIEELLRAAARTGVGMYMRLDPDEILDALPSPLPKRQRWRVYDEMMRQKAASLGRVRYGDKTPGHSQHLKKLFRDFPDARVILMVRDPRAAALSLSRMPWGSARDMANCIVNEEVRRKTKKFRNRVLQVRLEDLQRDPRHEMQRVLDFVGEKWDDAVLEHAGRSPDPIPVPPMPWLESSNTPVQRVSERPWGNISPARLRAIEFWTKKSLRFYGYQKAVLEKEPGRLAVLRQILSDIPETVRYGIAWGKLAYHLRKPEHWAYDDQTYRDLFMKVNPQCWTDFYPNFKWPEAEDYMVTQPPAAPVTATKQ